MTAIAPTVPPLSVAVAEAGLGIKAVLLLVAVTDKICPESPRPSVMLLRLIGVSAMADPGAILGERDGWLIVLSVGVLVDRQDSHGDGHGDRIDVAVSRSGRCPSG